MSACRHNVVPRRVLAQIAWQPRPSFCFSCTFNHSPTTPQVGKMICHPLILASRSFSSPISKLVRSSCSTTRHFSVKAIYSSFPATLHYYSPRHKSALFDHKGYGNRSRELFEEAVTVAEDGFVYPSVNAASS